MNKNYTPLVKSKIASKIFKTNIFYKLENLNYTGSHKDRECKYILSCSKIETITQLAVRLLGI